MECRAGNGCYACYPNDPTQCFICKSGYDHNENKECVKRDGTPSVSDD